jgi:hypothetical protein
MLLIWHVVSPGPFLQGFFDGTTKRLAISFSSPFFLVGFPKFAPMGLRPISLFSCAASAHGIRNELIEEFAKSKEMCLLIRKEKNVTCNQEA